MNGSKLVIVGLAALMITAGVVAGIPGQVADRPNEHVRNDHSDTPAPGTDANETTSDRRPVDGPDERGPPTDLPEPVPDFVSALHGTINDWLDGLLDGSLGEHVSEIAGHGEDAGDESDDGTTDPGSEADDG